MIGFGDWLRGQGIAEEQHRAYEQAAQLVRAEAAGSPAMPKHLDLAIMDAEKRGATPQQLANLQRMGEVFLRFSREGSRSAPGLASELPLPSFEPVAAASPAPAVSSSVASHAPGTCSFCGSTYGVGRGRLHIGAAGGVTGVASYLLVRLIGVLGVLVLLSGVGALGMVIAAVGTRVRCSGCGVLPDPGEAGPELSRKAWAQRVGFLAAAGGFVVLALALSVAWVAAIASLER